MVQRIFHDIVHNALTKWLKVLFRILIGKQGRFLSLDEYEIKYPEFCKYIYRMSPHWLTIDDNGSNKEIESNDLFVVCLREASCFAYSDVILLHNGDYFCDIKNDKYIGYCSDCHDDDVLLWDKKYMYDVRIPNDIVEIQNGIFLSGLFSWNYYHYTYQIIPRLGMLENVDSNIPLLVDKSTTEIESFAALLSICNLQNREVIVMQEKTRYKVHNLYVCSATTLLKPNQKPHTPQPKVGVRYNAFSLQFIRNTILPHLDKGFYPKRIFIGRKYVTSGRRPFNEEECIACTQEFGFEVVFPEKMNFVQQVALFSNAEYIIGGTGAAFTNLGYVSKGCHVIILSGYQITSGVWQVLCNYIGATIHTIYDHSLILDVNKPELRHCAYHIDVQELHHTINNII